MEAEIPLDPPASASLPRAAPRDPVYNPSVRAMISRWISLVPP
jgi:hypothetical protein